MTHRETSPQHELSDLRTHRSLRLASLHEERRRLDERAFYPVHDVRTESSAYTRVRRAMIEEEDQPCRVCGVRASTVGSRRANVYGATALEAHHHVIEWAHAEAIDLGRFNELVVAGLRERDGGKYGKRFSRGEMLAWIDHDRDNLWVLCDVHHRHAWFGVHAISGPVWGVQRLLRGEVVEEIRGVISRGGAGARASGGLAARHQ